jgi:hypothetical protein
VKLLADRGWRLCVYVVRLNDALPRIPLLLTVAYVAGLFGLGTITGTAAVDGVIGGLLGLYLCACPARATIDVLFADRFAFQRIWSSWAGRGWLALQGLVLLIGWAVVFVGMVCLVSA